MLKTNSKQARANVRAYIINHFSTDGYGFRGIVTKYATA